MKWIKNNLTLSVVLTLVLSLAAFGAIVVRTQVHAKDNMVHVDGTNYVPRSELEQVQIGIDDRLEAQDRVLDDIHDDVKTIQRMLMDQ
jgi:hypothetical protein